MCVGLGLFSGRSGVQMLASLLCNESVPRAAGWMQLRGLQAKQETPLSSITTQSVLETPLTSYVACRPNGVVTDPAISDDF